MQNMLLELNIMIFFPIDSKGRTLQNFGNFIALSSGFSLCSQLTIYNKSFRTAD